MSAELVLVNGNIITMNSAYPRAEAVAIKDELIIKIGTNNEIEQLIDDNTQVIQLEGKTVIPGIIDTHIHVADFGRLLMWLDLTASKSIEDIQKILKRKITKILPGKWILGRGWNEKFFKKGHFPTRFDLDKVAPDNPVIFYSESGKFCLVNSKALEFTTIGKNQSELQKENTIENNPIMSKKTGILEGKDMDLVWRVIPNPSEKELLALTNLACSKIVEAGITSVHWMVLSPLELSLIRKLKQKGLPLRIFIVIPFEIWKKDLKKSLSINQQDNSVKIGAIEISVDGYLARKTAALQSPYQSDCDSIGKLFYSQEYLNKSVLEILLSEYQLILHVMGDKAIKSALLAVEKTKNKTPNQENRVRLEQAALVNKKLVKKIKDQKLLVSIQPCVINSEFKTWSVIDNLGISRARWLYPVNTMIDNNILLIGGSDCPMEPLNPFLGIQELVTRNFFSKEAITTTKALSMYTINAAYSTKEEKIKGSIEEGKLADFIILTKDPTSVSLKNIEKIEVTTTIIGGKIVYSKKK
jgi:predicted amidohydrolase YtcJ